MICEDCHEPIKGTSCRAVCSSCEMYPGWRHELVAVRMLGAVSIAPLSRGRARVRYTERRRLAAQQKRAARNAIMEAAE